MKEMHGLQTVLNPSQLCAVTASAFERDPRLNHHHVSVVVSCKTHHVLASATNAALADASVHAEAAAMEKFCKRFRGKSCREQCRELCRGVEVFSLRVAPGGHLLCAKPCAACASTIRKCPQVRYLHWSKNDGALLRERIG